MAMYMHRHRGRQASSGSKPKRRHHHEHHHRRRRQHGPRHRLRLVGAAMPSRSDRNDRKKARRSPPTSREAQAGATSRPRASTEGLAERRSSSSLSPSRPPATSPPTNAVRSPARPWSTSRTRSTPPMTGWSRRRARARPRRSPPSAEEQGGQGLQHHFRRARSSPARSTAMLSTSSSPANDEEAKATVIRLRQRRQLRGIDAGKLERARQLEGLASPRITLQMPLGLGFQSAWKLVA